MEKKLKKITIRGVKQKLIELELLLIMSGYDNPLEEDWNNAQCMAGVNSTHLILYEDGEICYHNHPGFGADFKVTQVKSILKHIES